MLSSNARENNEPASSSEDAAKSADGRPRIRPNTWKQAAADDAVLAEIRRIAGLPGGAPLTGPFYDAHRSPQSVGSGRIIQRFGTWSEACHAAGVEVEERTRVYRRGWSQEDLLAWARRYLEDAGPAPSYKDFQQWLREHKNDGAPSAATMRNRLGTWVTIVERAVEE